MVSLKHHIFVLIGKSASGKDTIYGRLLADPTLHLHRVVPYTTRPMRSGEREGGEYHFVSHDQFLAMQAAGKIIEFRKYHTCYGPWYYFTAEDGQLRPDKEAALMIGTLASFLSMKEYYDKKGRDTSDARNVGDTLDTGNARNTVDTRIVVPLYVEVDNKIRYARARAREEAQQTPRFDELERRFAADETDFSEENLRKAGIARRFQNQNLDDCVQSLTEFIRSVERFEG